jgi:hypothetical protein
MPLHTFALGVALAPTVLHTLISHVSSCMRVDVEVHTDVAL